MLSSVEQAFVGREEKRAPLKTPAWEASKTLAKTQSCNRKLYSTETALLCVTDDLLQAIDDKKISALVLLDMSKT